MTFGVDIWVSKSIRFYSRLGKVISPNRARKWDKAGMSQGISIRWVYNYTIPFRTFLLHHTAVLHVNPTADRLKIRCVKDNTKRITGGRNGTPNDNRLKKLCSMGSRRCLEASESRAVLRPSTVDNQSWQLHVHSLRVATVTDKWVDNRILRGCLPSFYFSLSPSPRKSLSLLKS